MNIVLASTSSYRRSLLERLQFSFRCCAPEIDESPLPGEAPAELALRLSLSKAKAVAQRFPDSLVIGSDQVAALGDSLLGKPGTVTAAHEQLARCSGKQVRFFTGVAIVGMPTGSEWGHVEEFAVQFRTLAPDEIVRYIAKDEPLDCAGSFKVEGLGIALFEALSGRDPSALEGLPLIALSKELRGRGLEVP